MKRHRKEETLDSLEGLVQGLELEDSTLRFVNGAWPG